MSGSSRPARYVLAIDQGTTSTRAIIFDADATVVSSAQCEHTQILLKPGWVEHDALEIWRNVQVVVEQSLAIAGFDRGDIAAVGITNQRETTLVWNRHSGQPVSNAIVWQDTRTQPLVDRLARDGGHDRFVERTGLPLTTYFSATKLAWILDNVDGAREGAERGELIFGTMDSWLLWNLTGGADGGIHVTDVTNASRTLLMDLRTLAWDEATAADFGIPLQMLPRIASSSEIYGVVGRGGPLAGVPVAGILGDQQAAAFGQAAFDRGEVKNTYGTGNFLIMNTGTEIVRSSNGLISTLAYQLGSEAPRYALEGSVAVGGSLVQWLRDNLGIIDSADEIEGLALQVDDNGGAYIVPAFSGLFAPHWRPDARGAVVGLTRFVNKGHLARAALEAVAFQSSEVVDAMNADIGTPLIELRVDGGAAVNDLLLQLQADILGVPVVRPLVIETTALGAASVAGLAVGFWSGLEALRGNWQEERRWLPAADEARRLQLRRNWAKAVERTLNWVDDDVLV